MFVVPYVLVGEDDVDWKLDVTLDAEGVLEHRHEVPHVPADEPREQREDEKEIPQPASDQK